MLRGCLRRASQVLRYNLWLFFGLLLRSEVVSPLAVEEVQATRYRNRRRVIDTANSAFDLLREGSAASCLFRMA